MTTIFVQDATLLDCAVLSSEKGPCGKSWAVDVFWEGAQDKNGMLFDFSLAKKLAKQTIDHEFDHKILVRPTQVRYQSHSQIIIAENFKENGEDLFFALNSYSKAVKKISRDTLKGIENDDLSLLEKEIAQDILRNSPKNIRSVQVKLRSSLQFKMENYYHYTHSLCSHVGNCQRFHGHGSLIEVYSKKKINREKSKYLADFFNNKYIIAKSYEKSDWTSKLIRDIGQHCPEVDDLRESLQAVQYEGSQGAIGLLISKAKIISFDFESTVENIAYYAGQLLNDDKDIEIRALEGLCKGAIYP